MFPDWDEAGKESGDFVRQPDEWIESHFCTYDDDGRPLPKGPGGRPPFNSHVYPTATVIDLP